MNNIKILPEKEYNKIIKSVGSLSYCIFNPGESTPGDIFKRQCELQSYNYVVAGTGATISNYTFEYMSTNKHNQQYPIELTIPKGEEVIIARFLKFDDSGHQGTLPHYNAYDQLIFPTVKGHIVKLFRKDALDHFIPINKNSGIESIADAYKLPKQKKGSISDYFIDGASLPIEISLDE